MKTSVPAYPLTSYALSAPAAPHCPALAGEVRTEVAIVGGGFTGLSTALHLTESGIQSVVLESGSVGWGASGRNGGQVNPGLKREPAEILALFGRERGQRLLRAASDAPGYVFDLVERHGIDCEAVRNGTIRVARAVADFPLVEDYITGWAAEGVALARLEGAALADKLGTANYPLGVLDHRGGNLNPLAYARGLAAAAQRLGSAVHTDTKALKLYRENDGWVIETAHGRIRAKRVVLATNGYSDDLWPGLKQSVVPFASAIAATETLSPALLARILPGRQVAYESSWRVLYYRIDAQGRLLMGGPGAQYGALEPRAYRDLIQCALGLYPELAGVEWTHRWSGCVAVTEDHLPHLHEPAPGIIAALGYSGRGIAMATFMGREVAARVRGVDQELAFSPSPIKPFRFHRLWRPVATISTWKAATQDRLRGLI